MERGFGGVEFDPVLGLSCGAGSGGEDLVGGGGGDEEIDGKEEEGEEPAGEIQ